RSVCKGGQRGSSGVAALEEWATVDRNNRRQSWYVARHLKFLSRSLAALGFGEAALLVGAAAISVGEEALRPGGQPERGGPSPVGCSRSSAAVPGMARKGGPEAL